MLRLRSKAGQLSCAAQPASGGAAHERFVRRSPPRDRERGSPHSAFPVPLRGPNRAWQDSPESAGRPGCCRSSRRRNRPRNPGRSRSYTALVDQPEPAADSPQVKGRDVTISGDRLGNRFRPRASSSISSVFASRPARRGRATGRRRAGRGPGHGRRPAAGSAFPSRGSGRERRSRAARRP